MSWFYVDDGFPDHEKLARLPENMLTACVGLWTLAGAWSRRKLTGGNVPAGQVRRLGGKVKEADLLVTCGLWVKTNDGYAFHDWSEWQETPEEVNAKRELGKERARRWREKRGSRNAVTNALLTRESRTRNGRVPGEGEGEGEGESCTYTERDKLNSQGSFSGGGGPDILDETARQLAEEAGR